MSQQQKFLKRLRDSRQLPISRQQPPSQQRLLIPSTSSSQKPSSSSSSPSTHYVSKRNSSIGSTPGNIISIEDNLRVQLRQAKAYKRILVTKLSKTNLKTLTEANNNLVKKLRVANNRKNDLEEENSRLTQLEAQVLDDERIIIKVMKDDPGFILKLHASLMKLLNSNQPRNINTVSRKLQRKKSCMQAYITNKAAQELINDFPSQAPPLDNDDDLKIHKITRPVIHKISQSPHYQQNYVPPIVQDAKKLAQLHQFNDDIDVDNE